MDMRFFCGSRLNHWLPCRLKRSLNVFLFWVKKILQKYMNQQYVD